MPILLAIKKYWENLIDVNNITQITPDVYLKLYQLSKPKLDYEIIYMDEFQDVNPVMLSILLAQLQYGTQIICVGDKFQSIYKWNGAVDGFKYLPDNFKPMYLTESFRFTQDIADMATKLINIIGNDKQIIGNAVPRPHWEALPDIHGDYKNWVKAVLVRNNSTMLEYLLNAYEKGQKVYVLADLKSLWSKLYHVANLWGNKPVKYPDSDLAQYTTFKELKTASEDLPELKKLINLTVKLSEGNGLYRNIEGIKSIITLDKEEASFTIATGHKSKGLGFDEVTIAEDIFWLREGEAVIDKLLEEQTLELLYVMLTRVKYKINLPDKVREVIDNWESYKEQVENG